MKLNKLLVMFVALLLTACGLEDAAVTVVEPESAVEPAATTAMEPNPTSAAQPEPAGNSGDITGSEPDDAKPTGALMPRVNTFAEDDEPNWGDAFCPTTMPFCLRPFAINAQGNEQVLQVEYWGTGELFNAGSERLSISWRAFDEEGEGYTGNVCGNSTRRAARYQAGFGHLSRFCFNMEPRPDRLEITVNGAGNSFMVDMPVAAGNKEPVGGYSYAAGAAPLPLNEPFIVGPATVTIQALEDKGDHLVLELSIEAPAAEKLLVSSPDWIVVGSVLSFYTVDEMGIRAGWDEAKMQAYQTVGGEVAAGATQSGAVILTKAAADGVLLINYGPSLAIDTDAAIYMLPDAGPAGEGEDEVTDPVAVAPEPAAAATEQASVLEPSAPTDMVTATLDASAARPLSDEWYVDSDGNAIPDFLEIELGYDPSLDDCAPAMCTAAVADTDPTAVQDENVLVILDASGSMAEVMGGLTRMEAAKDALTGYVTALPSTARLGFMVYGHQGDNSEAGKPESCAGVELLAPVGHVSAESWPELLDSFAPNGWTPIAAALAASESAFAEADGGINRVILVTDGLETCGGDPVAAATRLHLDTEIQLIVDVVGFSIANEGDRAVLERLAAAGGGTYSDVQTAGDFNEYVAGLIGRARARLSYAVCIGREAVSTSVCASQLVLGANTAISTQIVSLGTDIGADRGDEIEALQLLQEAIAEAEERRFQQYQAWQNESARLLDEMAVLDAALGQPAGSP